MGYFVYANQRFFAGPYPDFDEAYEEMKSCVLDGLLEENMKIQVVSAHLSIKAEELEPQFTWHLDNES